MTRTNFGTHRHFTHRGFPAIAADRRVFDSVVDAVSQKVHQALPENGFPTTVQQGFTAPCHEPNRFTCFDRSVPNDALHSLEQLLGRHPEQ